MMIVMVVMVVMVTIIMVIMAILMKRVLTMLIVGSVTMMRQFCLCSSTFVFDVDLVFRNGNAVVK